MKMFMACLDTGPISQRAPILLYTPVTNEGDVHDAIEVHVGECGEEHRESCVPWEPDGVNPHMSWRDNVRLQSQYDDWQRDQEREPGSRMGTSF